MTNNAPTYYVQQFSSNVEMLLQQRGSKLRDCVMSGSHVGKQASVVEQIGEVVATKRTTRYPAMNPQDVPAGRPWVFPVDYDIDPIWLDNIDQIRMLANPQSGWVEATGYALGRMQDDEIINSFFNDRKVGENGSTNQTFDTSNQVVSVDTGGSASDLNVAKLIAAKKIFRANEVDLDNDPIYCAITAEQHEALMNEIQVVSKDFNEKPVLVDDKLDRWLGINFKHCERLETATDDQAGTSRAVPMWARSGVYLGIWMDVMMDVTQRKDRKGLPWQVYGQTTVGGTRLQEKKVVKIWCRE